MYCMLILSCCLSRFRQTAQKYQHILSVSRTVYLCTTIVLFNSEEYHLLFYSTEWSGFCSVVVILVCVGSERYLQLYTITRCARSIRNRLLQRTDWLIHPFLKKARWLLSAVYSIFCMMHFWMWLQFPEFTRVAQTKGKDVNSLVQMLMNKYLFQSHNIHCQSTLNANAQTLVKDRPTMRLIHGYNTQSLLRLVPLGVNRMGSVQKLQKRHLTKKELV